MQIAIQFVYRVVEIYSICIGGSYIRVVQSWIGCNLYKIISVRTIDVHTAIVSDRNIYASANAILQT